MEDARKPHAESQHALTPAGRDGEPWSGNMGECPYFQDLVSYTGQVWGRGIQVWGGDGHNGRYARGANTMGRHENSVNEEA